MDIEEKLKFADFIIKNISSIEDLKKQVKEVFTQLKRINDEKS